MPELVRNDLPSAFLRAFGEQEHARRLLECGEIRFRRLDTYRDDKDPARADPSEGQAQFRIPGKVPRVAVDLDGDTLRMLAPVDDYFNYSGDWGNPFYVLCGSLPTVDRTHLASFGNAVVEVFDARCMFDSIDRATQELQVRGYGRRCLFGLRIAYDKGGIRSSEEAQRMESSFGFKPAKFATDQEVRIVVGFNGPLSTSPTHLTLQLEDPRSFCRRA